uniref:galactosylgalactosylxylosylprotein 3-beta-glucuronosyltransferase 2 n=1 Tax=Monopterus albus TaxID=43700 RepID=UPI003D7D335E
MRAHGNFNLTMKSVFFSRFFILLPWVLIVIIMIDIESKRTIWARAGKAQWASRTSAPALGTTQNQSAIPVIYAITPTYTRPVQKAELTRLAHAFRQVPRFHWIVVEDSPVRTELVARFLARCGVPYTHLHMFTPRRFKRAGMPRATEQRNAALAWLRQHRSKRDAGVVFFADDDNTYSLELFEEVTDTYTCYRRYSLTARFRCIPLKRVLAAEEDRLFRTVI